MCTCVCVHGRIVATYFTNVCHERHEESSVSVSSLVVGLWVEEDKHFLCGSILVGTRVV